MHNRAACFAGGSFCFVIKIELECYINFLKLGILTDSIFLRRR